MTVRVPSEIEQLNDSIVFPVVGSLNVRVDDIDGLFTTQSGIGSGIGYRGYKNLDEVLAQLKNGISFGSGVIIQDEGVTLGAFNKLNFSGIGVQAIPDGDRVTVVVSASGQGEGSNAFAWFMRGGI